MHVMKQSCLLFTWLITVNLLSAEESYDVRLVGGTNHCTGRLEMKHQGEWRPVIGWSYWNLKSASVVCRQLDCGSAVSSEISAASTALPAIVILSSCVGSESSLRECGDGGKAPVSTSARLEVTCSESLRLVNGTTSVCSGRVEVKSNQSWVSVCEGDFDQQDAEVVCRELGCGAPSVLQEALYGEAKAPMWTKEFKCEGNESALLNCGASDSTRNTCLHDKAVGLTCSKSNDLRFMGGNSNCVGTLEMKHQGEWRPVDGTWDWNLKTASVVCRQQDCGSAVSTERRSGFTVQPVWRVVPSCAGSESSLRECGILESVDEAIGRQEVICSGML